MLRMGVCLLLIDLFEGLNLHVSADGLPFVDLLEEHRADDADD